LAKIILVQRDLRQRVYRFLLGTIYQNGGKIPKCHKIYHSVTKYTTLSQNIPHCHKIYHIVTKYTTLSQNIPHCHKIYHIVTKYTTLSQNIPNGHKICSSQPLSWPASGHRICLKTLVRIPLGNDFFW
jgi:hypothetical protein